LCPDIGVFLQTVQEVYTSTVESDWGLRRAVVNTLLKHPSWLVDTSLKEAAKDLGLDFWVTLPVSEGLVLEVRC